MDQQVGAVEEHRVNRTDRHRRAGQHAGKGYKPPPDAVGHRNV